MNIFNDGRSFGLAEYKRPITQDLGTTDDATIEKLLDKQRRHLIGIFGNVY